MHVDFRDVRVVPRVQHQMLRSDHRDRRLAGDDFGQLDGCGHDFLATAGYDAAHETYLPRLGRLEGARGEGEFPREALVADDLREAREGADIRGEAHIDFLCIVLR